jgi:4-diphosphocytidyl-2-C-methyl-D-erythritol kinase
VTAALRRLAPAKINLHLHVTGRRPDGYHLIDSLVGLVGVGDRLSVTPADGISLTVEGPYAAMAGGGEANLVLRAARGLAELCRIERGAALVLEKHLPVAAGLGGGSSDAAAALRLLAALWGVTPDPAALDRLALSLGADVPACLSGRPALVGGIGEQIAPTWLPPAHILLANPRIELPTPRVFAALAGRFAPPAEADAMPGDAIGLAAMLAKRRNDLEAPARELVPVIGTVIDRLRRLPGALLARMSGSGATCFALFATAATAATAATELARDEPGWWIADGPLLAAAPGIEAA